MTEEKKEAPKAEKTNQGENFVKEFTELPLEKKLANLMKLEAIALGETFSYVINSPYTIADKVMDVMAEFGFKKEEEAKKAGASGRGFCGRTTAGEEKIAGPAEKKEATGKRSARKKA